MKNSTLPLIMAIVGVLYCTPLLAQDEDPTVALEQLEGEEKIKGYNDLYKEYINSEPEKALEYAKIAFELSQEAEYKKGIASGYNNLGVFHRGQGTLDKALEYYIKSLRISQEIGNREGEATAMNNIGTIYALKNENDQALENFLYSYKIFDSLKLESNMVGSLTNIGNAYSSKGEDYRAIEFFREALIKYESIGQKDKLFDPLTSIGNIHFRRKEYDKAFDFYNRSLDIETENNNVFGQAYAYSNIGTVYLHLKNYNRALENKQKALNLAETVGAASILQEVNKSLSEIHYQFGNMQKAYEHRVAYDELQHLLNSQQTNRKLAQLEVAYEFEKKEEELEKLRAESALNALRAENSRIIILVGVMGAIIVMGAFFIVYTLRRHKEVEVAQ